jgi:competence transcription factor ComK
VSSEVVCCCSYVKLYVGKKSPYSVTRLLDITPTPALPSILNPITLTLSATTLSLTNTDCRAVE